VSVAADGVPLREFVAAWARFGQARVTGLELLPDRPVTLHDQCADERQMLDALLDGVDRVLAPRASVTSGVSKFSSIVILSGDSSHPRRTAAPNAIPEMQYPDPMPGHEWASAPPDPDSPPRVVIEPMPPAWRATHFGPDVPETAYEYARPVTSGPSGILLPSETYRDQDRFLTLIESIRSGAVPESLFEYARPVGKDTDPAKGH
jgi:hypothetical protein